MPDPAESGMAAPCATVCAQSRSYSQRRCYVSVLGNIIWLICGGFFTGLGYIIGGLALCLTIVGIPFGLQSIKLGAATMTPFGMEIVPSEEGGGPLRPLFYPPGASLVP